MTPAMQKSLREEVKRMLLDSDVPYTTISNKSGVPYPALYHFATKGDDMKSQHMEKLYEYFTGNLLIQDDSDES